MNGHTNGNGTTIHKPKAVCVFCASSMGNEPEFREAAESLGRAIALQGRKLVYGGGSSGLMGTVSQSCRDAGGRTIGFVPQAIADGGGEQGVDHNVIPKDDGDTVIVSSMHERKTRMAEAAQGGFLGLPGGYGTLDEVLEAVTWVQLGIHEKPMILLNVKGYYTPLKQLIDGGVKSGFIKANFAELVKFVEKPEDEASFNWGKAALEALESWRMPKCGAMFSTWSNLSQA